MGPAREQYLDREALRLALDFMTRHPMAALQIWPRKLWHLYGRDGDGFDWTIAGIGTDDGLRTLVWRVAQINKVYYLVLVLISGVGFLHFASTGRRADAVSADLLYRSPVPFPADAVGGHVRCLAHQPRLVRSAGLW
jgi:hypothetical protein